MIGANKRADKERITMKILIILVIGAIAFVAGCAPVPFHQREMLSKTFMKFDSEPEVDGFHNDVYSAREGASGGFSLGGGGGCGCK